MYSFSSQDDSLSNGAFDEDIIWAMKQRNECRKRIDRDISLLSVGRLASSFSLKYQKETLSQTMATLLPNEVISNIDRYTPVVFSGCLLTGKISGVIEQLDIREQPKREAAHEMTKTLNFHLGSVLEEIMNFDGDILNITPDSFLVLWKSGSTSMLSYYIHSAVNCALVIQKKFKKFALTDKVILQVKLAITAGSITFSLLTDYERSSFVYFGLPVNEMVGMESYNLWGDIIVASSAWQYVDPSEYSWLQAENGVYYKVLGVGLQWKCVGRGGVLKRGSTFENTSLLDLGEDDVTSTEDDLHLVEDSELCILRRTQDFALRPILIDLGEISDNLSKFLPTPLSTVIFDEEPLSSLEEIRQIVAMRVDISLENSNVDNLEMARQGYKIVCKQANEYKGVVVKSAIANGIITFLVLFGLRGLTDVLESQEALRCAVRCHHDLDLFDEAEAVTIACTTGNCYCGVFGHSLRRTYAVYGRCLDKSARMVQANLGKIMCDRPTFIYSNLDSQNFGLLPQVEEDVGNDPLYEFNVEYDESIFQKEASFLPLLGRDEEIETFLKLFKIYVQNFGIEPCCNFARCSFKNCIIFEGVYRQGKSRLLQELQEKVVDTPVQMITFHGNNSMISYNGARELMKHSLGFENYIAEYFRRKRIKEKLGASAKQDSLHVLNDVFDVNFKAPKRFSEDDKPELMRDCIKLLCKKCFEVPTLILMDNADCMDEETWELLIPMLETKRFFLVATLDRSRKDLTNMESVIESHHTKKIVLKRIPQIYIAGLVCQILKVYAIPADLEKVIQSNSKGNPGWIENFLLILQQTKKISVSSVSFKSIHQMSLVAPPLYMLKRLSPQNVTYYKNLLEEKSSRQTVVNDPWHVYIDSCRDAFRDVDVRSGMQEIFCETTQVPVCLFTAPFDPKTDVDPNVTEDLDFLQIYDKLTYQEQLMVRCAAVLGNPFTRRLLFFIWTPVSEKKAAEVIQNIFEKGLINCARGDFSSGGDYLLCREKSYDPESCISAECHCIGLDIPDPCLFMPKYASCGYMRFKSEHFAGVAYDLISEEERKELHFRAAKFIQKDTRRCVSCGCGFFPVNFGCKMDSNTLGRAHTKEYKVKSIQLQHMNFNELYNYSTHSGNRATITSKSLERGTRGTLQSHFKNTKSITISDTSEDRFIDLTFEDKHSKSLKFVNPLKLLKLRKRASLVRTFSQSDFLTCDCHLILNHMYRRLKHHYKGCERWHDMVVTCIHYARISMANNNFASAMKTIEEAIDMLKNKEHLFSEPPWKIRMLIAKFYCLKGDLLRQLGNEEDALNTFLETLKIFGLPFPDDEKNVRFQLRLLQQKWKQKIRLYFIPASFMNDESDNVQLYIANSISETLTHLCRIFMAKGKWRFAELAGYLSLKNSLQTETNLIRICEAFRDMLLIAQHFENNLLLLSLEVHALRYCHKKRNFVEAPELKSISTLYLSIFEVRMARSEFDAALQIGYIGVSVATKCTDTTTTINLLVLIAYILFNELIVNDGTTILRELEYFADEIENNSGRTWYFALAVSFHLETGYIISPFGIVEMYYNSESNNFNDKFYDAKMRLIVTMWVWYLRNDFWENTFVFKKDLESYRNCKIDNNNRAITHLYLLEGTLLTLVNRINRRSITGMIEWKKKADVLLKKIHKAASSRKFIKAKLYLLDAYYAYILDNKDKTKKLLNKARKLSLTHGNKLVAHHLEHSEKAWKNELSSTVRDFWKNHCTNDTYISHHEMEIDNPKIYCFTYPKPLFRV